MKKHILAPLIALTLLAPLAAGAEEMDEDRIKALVYEAIRENPGIVMEAVRLLEEQQQREHEQRDAGPVHRRRPPRPCRASGMSSSRIRMRRFWAILTAM